MITHRSAVIIAAAIIGIILLATLQSPPPIRDTEIQITILTTSDLQSRVFPPGVVDGVQSPGLSAIAATADQIRPGGDHTLLLSGGDDLIGAVYSLFHGEPEYRGMTEAGYDAVCPGNHEFGTGYEIYAEAVHHAGFPILSANMAFENGTLREAIRPWTIIRQDGLSIGIFGLMTPRLHLIAQAGPGVTVTEPVAAAETAIRSLQAEGVGLILCLSHMGIEEDTRLAENVRGMHAIIGGHDHIIISKEVRDPDGRIVPIVQAGQYGDDLGVLRLTIQDGDLLNWHFETVRPEGSNPDVSSVLAPFITAFREEMQKPVGEITYPLDTRKEVVRGGESAVGDLITDTWRDWFPEAEIALINGGSIRGDRIFAAGPISWGMMTEILPYGSELVLVRMSGEEIAETLEVSASALRVPGDERFSGDRPPTGGFLQVSGIRFTIDLSGDPFTARYNEKNLGEIITKGNRVSDIQVNRSGGWEELRGDLHYTVAVNTWLASGGDGHYAISQAAGPEYIGTTVRDIDPVIHLIKKGMVDPDPGEERIRIVQQSPSTTST
jgi:2',3'-cyclic-nucleotide 2'-phosphodiesterase (5'-nucleotidase family)